LRIFAVCHRVPYPPNKGEKIRSHHLLRRLAEDAEVHLFATADPASDVEHQETLEDWYASVTLAPIHLQARKIASLSLAATPIPLTMPAFFSPAIWFEMRRQAKSTPPDVLLLESSSTGAYAWALPDVPAVMDFVDADSEKWRDLAKESRLPASWVYAREALTLSWAERLIARRCSACAVTTEREAESLRRIAPEGEFHVVHNGVDTGFFGGGPAAESRPDTPGLVFFGMMDYPPNIGAVEWFCDHVLPTLQERYPGLRFVIAGGRPTEVVQALEKRPGVEVTGFVDDLRPVVRACDVCVFPLQVARGVQNKVLEGMAMGMPVVVSDVAAQGIDDLTGDEMLIRDSPESWISAVSELLDDKAARSALGARARRFVETVYEWGPQAGRLRAVLEAAAAR
jgi:sugar transferase (PEP-CTERM/EpsH1 system associated)